MLYFCRNDTVFIQVRMGRIAKKARPRKFQQIENHAELFPASEFVGNPRGEIIYVLVSSGFLDKITRKKVSVNGDEGYVAVEVPFQLPVDASEFIGSPFFDGIISVRMQTQYKGLFNCHN